MTVLEPPSSALAFGDVDRRIVIGAAHYEPDTRTLAMNGDRLTLEPRIGDLLMSLIKAGGRPVSRDALLDDIWGLSGSDEALTQAISKLRRALNDTVRPHQIIQTVPKTGYQLGVAPRAAAAPAAEEGWRRLSATVKPLLRSIQQHRSYWNGFLTGAGICTAAAVGFLLVNPPQSIEIEKLCAPSNGPVQCDLEFE